MTHRLECIVRAQTAATHAEEIDQLTIAENRVATSKEYHDAISLIKEGLKKPGAHAFRNTMVNMNPAENWFGADAETIGYVVRTLRITEPDAFGNPILSEAAWCLQLQAVQSHLNSDSAKKILNESTRQKRLQDVKKALVTNILALDRLIPKNPSA